MKSLVGLLRAYLAERRRDGVPLELATMQSFTGWTEPEVFRRLQTELIPAREAGASPLCRERPAMTPRALQREIDAEQDAKAERRSQPITADIEERLKVLAEAVGR